jgi:hypothetical protein
MLRMVQSLVQHGITQHKGSIYVLWSYRTVVTEMGSLVGMKDHGRIHHFHN